MTRDESWRAPLRSLREQFQTAAGSTGALIINSIEWVRGPATNQPPTELWNDWVNSRGYVHSHWWSALEPERAGLATNPQRLNGVPQPERIAGFFAAKGCHDVASLDRANITAPASQIQTLFETAGRLVQGIVHPYLRPNGLWSRTRSDEWRWLLILYELAWRERPANPLKAERIVLVAARQGCGLVPADPGKLESVRSGPHANAMMGDNFDRLQRLVNPTDWFCASLEPGVFLASVLAIDLLLDAVVEQSAPRDRPGVAGVESAAPPEGTIAEGKVAPKGGKPKPLPLAIQKAGAALEAAVAARDDLIPETGRSPSVRLWEWARENYYPPKQCPKYKTFCRYIRAYYQSDSSSKQRGMPAPDTRSTIRAKDTVRR